MSFKKFRKKEMPLPPKDGGNEKRILNAVEPRNKLSLKERLFKDHAKGLYNVFLWFPLFGMCWLSSGIVIKNLNLFSLIVAPLIGLFLYLEKEDRLSSHSYRHRVTFLVIASILWTFFLYDYDPRAILAGSFLVVALSMVANWLFSQILIENLVLVFIRALFPLVFISGLLFIGFFSQITRDFQWEDCQYLFLVLIPGTVLIGRQLLFSSEMLKKKGWKFESSKILKSGESVLRPAGLGRLVIGTLIIGPAIPALLLPFDLLPRSFFVVSLIFLVMPKIASMIQAEIGTLEERIISVTKVEAIVMVLTFMSAFINLIL